MRDASANVRRQTVLRDAISLALLKRHHDRWKSTIGVFGLGYIVAVELVMRFVARCVPLNVNAWDCIRTKSLD